MSEHIKGPGQISDKPLGGGGTLGLHPPDSGPVSSNAYRLLWAGFMAILAAGVGFAIRGGILADWAASTASPPRRIGDINGAGLTGFCFGIIIGGLVADKIGYGKLVVAAFLLHVVSAVMSLGGPGAARRNATAYTFLYWGSFIFAVANGTLEARGQPAGGDAVPAQPHALPQHPARELAGRAGARRRSCTVLLGDQLHLGWRWQLGLFLVPTVMYGLLFLGQRMPKSEAAEKGLSFGEMFKDVGILGSLVVCYLLVPVLQGRSCTSPQYVSIRDRRRAAGRRGRHHQVLVRGDPAVRPVRHARPGRRGRAGHGRVDPEHHRQHPHARRRARSCSSGRRC